MNILNWNRTIEALSEKMPDPVDTIKASEHTLRMLSHNAGYFDRETCKEDRAKGIRGYLWGITFKVDPSLKNGVFAYYEGDTHKGTLDYSMCPDGVYSPGPLPGYHPEEGVIPWNPSPAKP